MSEGSHTPEHEPDRPRVEPGEQKAKERRAITKRGQVRRGHRTVSAAEAWGPR